MTIEELFEQEELKFLNHSFVQELTNSETQISPERYATHLFNLHPQINILEQLAIPHDVTMIRLAPAIWNDYKDLWSTVENSTVPPTKLPIVDEYVSRLMKIRDDNRSLKSHSYVHHMLYLNLKTNINTPGENRLFNYPETIEAVKQRYDDHEVPYYDIEMQRAFDFIYKHLDQMAEL